MQLKAPFTRNKNNRGSLALSQSNTGLCNIPVATPSLRLQFHQILTFLLITTTLSQIYI